MTTERNAQGVDVLASDREMIRWLNGDVLTVLLDVSNEISSPGQQSMARGAIRRVEAIVDRLHSHGPAVAELVAADLEYNAARSALESTPLVGFGYRHLQENLDRASVRRAAALSNIEGGQA